MSEENVEIVRQQIYAYLCLRLSGLGGRRSIQLSYRGRCGG